MVYKRGRFVIHYKDGSTYMEDRDDPHAWDNRPRKPIAALGIQPDTNILVTMIKTDPATKKESKHEVPVDFSSNDPNTKFILGEMTLKGSWKYNYGFWMDKLADRKLFGGSRKVWGMRIGMVVDKLGHCVVLEYVGTGSPRMYYTSCQSMQMDAHSLKVNYDINLEELPDPVDNFFPYPEINPAKIEARRKREEEAKEAHKAKAALKSKA